MVFLVFFGFPMFFFRFFVIVGVFWGGAREGRAGAGGGGGGAGGGGGGGGRGEGGGGGGRGVEGVLVVTSSSYSSSYFAVLRIM